MRCRSSSALGASLLLQEEDAAQQTAAPELPPLRAGAAVTASAITRADTVFIDHDYLIKGVAGAILWKIVREYAESGRVEFTNRELRLDRRSACRNMPRTSRPAWSSCKPPASATPASPSTNAAVAASASLSTGVWCSKTSPASPQSRV